MKRYKYRERKSPMMRMATRFVFAFALLGLVALPASADTLTFYLDNEFSGATPPAGTAPWVTLTFLDIVGGVRLTIENVGLVGTEFNTGVYWNFDPSKNAAVFSPTAIGTGLGTQTAWNSMSSGNDQWKPDGDGFFDFRLNLPPPGDTFTAGETFVLEWIGLGLTTADFDFTSVNGPVGKTGFNAAAHIQGIGTSGNDSGWIEGGKIAQVPEPSSLVLVGSGLFGLAALARRKR